MKKNEVPPTAQLFLNKQRNYSINTTSCFTVRKCYVLVQSDVHEASVIIFSASSKQDKRIHKDLPKGGANTGGGGDSCKQLVSCNRNLNCMNIVA
jgi:hypothetical protein